MRLSIRQCERALGVLAMLIAIRAIGTAQAFPIRPTADFRSWFTYVGDHHFGSSHLSLMLEGQIRINEFENHDGVYVARSGLQYDVKKWLRVAGGYSYQLSDPGITEFAVPEHRAFEQVLLRQRLGRVPIQHRFRLEQRWLGTGVIHGGLFPEVSGWEYRNRIRYAARAVIPVTKRAGPKYYVSVQNELLLNFGKGTRNVYDQYRAGGGFGYHIGAIGNIETGYLLQAQNSPSDIVSYHHVLTVTLVSTLPFGKH